MNHNQKHIPQRTCVICRNKVDKRRLTRLVLTADGVFIDPTGKQNGRGAYLCDSVSCRDRAATTDLVGRALRVDLSDADRERIREMTAS